MYINTNTIKMRKLELLKQLNEQFDMCFVDKDNIRVCEWVGYKNESSKRKGLKFLGLSELEKELKQMEKSGQLEMIFDDEVMHFSFFVDKDPMQIVKELDLDWDDNWGWRRNQQNKS